MKIAIPTFERPETLKSKTIAYLLRTNFQMKNVFIFVADKEQQKIYDGAGVKNTIVGERTIKAQRNFIRKFFKEGEDVFSLDDDVDGLYRATAVKTLEEVKDLTEFIRYGFDACRKHRTKLWGVSAVLNPFFMFGKKPTTDLKYIVGAAFGQIIDHAPFLAQTIDDKGDYERSIKYFIRYQRIVRINEVAVKTRYYKQAGGMQIERTKQRVKASGLYLLNKYPKYCKVNSSKKNKEFFEIKLIKQ